MAPREQRYSFYWRRRPGNQAMKAEDPAEECAIRRKLLTVRDMCRRFPEATEKGSKTGIITPPFVASTFKKFLDQVHNPSKLTSNNNEPRADS
jgi:hypothetical protein